MHREGSPEVRHAGLSAGSEVTAPMGTCMLGMLSRGRAGTVSRLGSAGSPSPGSSTWCPAPLPPAPQLPERRAGCSHQPGGHHLPDTGLHKTITQWDHPVPSSLLSMCSGAGISFFSCFLRLLYTQRHHTNSTAALLFIPTYFWCLASSECPDFPPY